LVGGAPVAWLPSVDPEVVIWSDLKSHVFHATFLANPFAIPAASPVYGGEARTPRTEADGHTESHFNYLILMGGDYGPWSASAGTYYPARYIRLLPFQRDVRAKQAALVFRARATFEWLAFSAMYFRVRQDDPEGDGLWNGENDEDETQGIPYALREDTVRLGASVELFEMKGSLDTVLTRGEYQEEPAFGLDFKHLQLGTTLSREFGHYVRMNVHVNYHIENNHFERDDGTERRQTRTQLDYGGAFEFQF
jgi:hypothetical protein